MFLQEISTLFNGRMAKFYYVLFNLVAIAIIIYLGVDTFYRIISLKYVAVETVTTAAPVAEMETTSVRASRSDYQVIADRNIFSKTAVTAQKGDINVDDLDSTSLKLVLAGTFAGNDDTSAAVIEDATTRPVTKGLYRIGDKIQNAEIKSILRKKVILRVGNKDEVLTMEEAASGQTTKGQQTETVTEEVQTASSVIERNIPIKRSLINDSLKDLNELLSQATVKPHSTDGEADGLTITGIKAGSIYRRMGLRNGDIIKGVNNEPIKTTEDLIGMYNDLKSSPEVSLQITRRGQERSFNYSLTD